MKANSGRQEDEGDGRDNDVEQALRVARRGRKAQGAKADERQCLDRVHVDARPDSLEEIRHEVDLHRSRLQPADHREQRFVRLGRVGNDHPVDVEPLDELRQYVGRAQHSELPEISSRLSRPRVDEADEPDRVLGMLLEFARDELTDVAGADDDGVLPEHRHPPSGGPCQRSSADDEGDRHDPEGDRPPYARTRRAREGDEHREEPHANRDHGEYTARSRPPSNDRHVGYRARKDQPGRPLRARSEG